MSVKLQLKSGDKMTLNNVTEVHYSHPPERRSVAFESDIHSTGVNLLIEDVLEFEVRPMNELAPDFVG
jgi:hypothetical protein